MEASGNRRRRDYIGDALSASLRCQVDVESILKTALVLVPKGLQASARGFSPGSTPKMPALEGRKTIA